MNQYGAVILGRNLGDFSAAADYAIINIKNTEIINLSLIIDPGRKEFIVTYYFKQTWENFPPVPVLNVNVPRSLRFDGGSMDKKGPRPREIRKEGGFVPH